MKRLASTILAGALSAGLMAGCAGPSPENNSAYHLEVLADDVAYWQSIGVTGLEGITLQTVINGERTDCSNVKPNGEFGDSVVSSYSPSPATYCPEERTIVISSDTYKRVEAAAAKHGISAEVFGALIIGHELGHGILFGFVGTRRLDPQHEQTADCLAAQVVSANQPDMVESARKVYEVYGSGPNHGTVEERQASFDAGAGHHGCHPKVPSGGA